ncbi:NADH-cytochrome b5 reductase 2 [Smittium culicis]|uniref:NADH-cytochrome b5 reductase n=1 Tax=Smittium culicis TaxID=133412 RepID=A0A1R1XPU3_9FUNG|nr:NADH-cytochrome b5 reductase 2 [Smittium culicis]
MSSDTSATALDSNRFVPLPLSEIVRISHNTQLYRFKIDDNQKSGMFVASCLLTMFTPKEGGEPVIRPYTPTSQENQKGFMDLIIKTYPDGKMSQHIANMKVGETLLFKGPLSKYPYIRNSKKEIGMIAGGTGITPMLQVIDKVVPDTEDNTIIKLLFANNSEDDILCKSHLDDLATKFPNKLHVNYILSKPKTSTWTGDVGRVDAELIKKYMPSSSLGDDTVIFVCGPPGMVDTVSGPKVNPAVQGPLTGILKELNFSESNVFKF